MLKYQVWLFIGVALLIFHLQFASAVLCPDDYFEAVGICFRKDGKCPDGNIFFNGECYYITNKYCSSSQLWINGKCCTIDCLKSCSNGYCSHCCNILSFTVPPLISENPTPPNPNQIVTPYPVVPVNPISPTSDCPNQPVAPYPVVPVNLIPLASDCPNQPVTPYPLVPVNPMAPNANLSWCGQIPCSQRRCIQNCLHNSDQPCSQPCIKSCCSNNCVQKTFSPMDCQSICLTNCCSTTLQPPITSQPQITPDPPITPEPPITPQTPITPQPPITSQPPITPQPPTCPQPPITPLPPAIPPTNPSVPPLPSTITPPTNSNTPPPANITRCQPGTIQIGRTCHLIYCPRGSVISDDRCVAIECPEGTVWTGYRCSMPEPIMRNLTFHNTVITNFNNSKPDIILHNTNNIVVNASIFLQEESPSYDCFSEESNCDPTPLPSLLSTTTNPMKCCEVMTPRICENRNNRWYCYSRRYRRCGEFCITPIIYLRPPRVQVRSKYVVVPPLQHDCHLSANGGKFTGGFDCSGCGMRLMESCSYYCYRYSCPSQRCSFYDQEEYCSHYAGSYGCQEEDGCYDDWCQ